MIPFVFSLIIGIGLLYLTENNTKTSPFVVCLFLFLAGVFDLSGMSSLTAVYSAFVFLSVFYLASRLKVRMTRFPLFYNDLFAFDFAVLRDIVMLYPWQTVFAVSLIVPFALSAFWTTQTFVFDIGLEGALVLILAGGTGIALTLGRAIANTRGWMVHRAYITAFFGQAIEQRLLRTDMRVLDLPETTPDKNVRHPPRKKVAKAPHILLLVHESTFPPFASSPLIIKITTS